MEVLVIGAGLIAKEYLKILESLNLKFIVVGRSAEKLNLIKNEFHCEVVEGGVKNFLDSTERFFDFAINATGTNDLYQVNRALSSSGKIKNILSEKPGAFTSEEFNDLNDQCLKTETNLYLAYNRRNYASVQKIKEILILEKMTSIFFEFTEWFWRIDTANYTKETIKEWLLCNSSHVIDLAFYLGNGVESIHCLSKKDNKQAINNSQYAGSGLMKNGALFSYIANWESAGRWRLEISTIEGRYLLSPLEELAFQKRGTLNYVTVEVDNSKDVSFKPGFFEQVRSFLFDQNPNLKSIKEQIVDVKLFDKIKG